MLLEAALNGARSAGEHPDLPITSEHLATDARACAGAGADAIHLHVRAPDGRESLAPEDVARTLGRVRSACPGTLAGIHAPRLLHGTDATAWPLLAEAAARGYQARIGFEDVLTRPDGVRAGSNAELVSIAREILARATGVPEPRVPGSAARGSPDPLLEIPPDGDRR